MFILYNMLFIVPDRTMTDHHDNLDDITMADRAMGVRMELALASTRMRAFGRSVMDAVRREAGRMMSAEAYGLGRLASAGEITYGGTPVTEQEPPDEDV
jgi:hypothetical protein